MNKLLNAGFARLGKNRLFWLLIAFTIGLSLFMVSISYSDFRKYGIASETEQLMFNYSTMTGVVTAIFASLFLGVEYSDGAIRNKISTGHKRSNIYLSNLIILSAASLFSYVLFVVMTAVIGIPLLGGITMSAPRLLAMLGCILLTSAAYSSIFTFSTMTISNKALSAVTGIMLAFGMLFAALTCLNILETPKEVLAGSMTDSESGEIEWIYEPNPKYPSEEKRKVCQILLDINPAGQMFQIAGRTVPALTVLPLYALGEFVLFAGAGVLLFERKELK